MQTEQNMSREVAAPTQDVKAKAVRKSSKKAVFIIFTISLILALSTVLLGPVFVDGAEVSTTSQNTTAAEPSVSIQTFETTQEAAAVLGFAPRLPSAIPDGYQLAEIRALDGSVLELVYEARQNTISFRTALGTGDLSSSEEDEYAFALTDEDGAVIRSYAGSSQERMHTAVWVQDDASYAILAENGLTADEMRSIARSVA